MNAAAAGASALSSVAEAEPSDDGSVEDEASSADVVSTPAMAAAAAARTAAWAIRGICADLALQASRIAPRTAGPCPVASASSAASHSAAHSAHPPQPAAQHSLRVLRAYLRRDHLSLGEAGDSTAHDGRGGAGYCPCRDPTTGHSCCRCGVAVAGDDPSPQELWLAAAGSGAGGAVGDASSGGLVPFLSAPFALRLLHAFSGCLGTALCAPLPLLEALLLPAAAASGVPRHTLRLLHRATHRDVSVAACIGGGGHTGGGVSGCEAESEPEPGLLLWRAVQGAAKQPPEAGCTDAASAVAVAEATRHALQSLLLREPSASEDGSSASVCAAGVAVVAAPGDAAFGAEELGVMDLHDGVGDREGCGGSSAAAGVAEWALSGTAEEHRDPPPWLRAPARMFAGLLHEGRQFAVAGNGADEEGLGGDSSLEGRQIAAPFLCAGQTSASKRPGGFAGGCFCGGMTNGPFVPVSAMHALPLPPSPWVPLPLAAAVMAPTPAKLRMMPTPLAPAAFPVRQAFPDYAAAGRPQWQPGSAVQALRQSTHRNALPPA